MFNGSISKLRSSNLYFLICYQDDSLIFVDEDCELSNIIIDFLIPNFSQIKMRELIETRDKIFYFTVTDFAKFRGLSGSYPRKMANW